MANIIEEINEDIKKERLDALLKKLTPYLIYGLIAVVLATAAGVWWKDRVLEQKQELSANYFKIMKNIDDLDEQEVNNSLDGLVNKSANDVPALAGFTQASLLIQEEKIKEAVDLYAKLAENHGNNPIYSDLALLNKITLQLNNSMEDFSIESDLEKIASAGRPWSGSAKLLQANYYLKHNNKVQATSSLKDILADDQVPTIIKKIANDSLTVIGE